MADVLTTITTLINSPPGQLAAGGVLAGEIKTNATVWELRFNSVETKLDTHREKWKSVVPDPRKARP